MLCQPLEKEDFVVQPVVDVSPLKWHLAHTTWFFETFILVPLFSGYKLFNEKYPMLFNSYYISAGDRWTREKRGTLTRPTVDEVFDYRAYVNTKMFEFMKSEAMCEEASDLIELGCNHEQQHQELFMYDVKRILGDNPLYPEYKKTNPKASKAKTPVEWLKMPEGIYDIGHCGNGFHFDNEGGMHKRFLHAYELSSQLVTNSEYLDFIQDGGYQNHFLWLSEGWDWVNENNIAAPRYWQQEGTGDWHQYTLSGYKKVNPDIPVSHVSYYEAEAFARWKNCRLPTEFEWEAAVTKYTPEVPSSANFIEKENFEPVKTDGYDFFGNLWEWTSSAYAPYPYFNIADGALGEYNGKFMINQMVLRGGSFATSKNHIRATYRNFFHPHLQWLFSGIRLAKHS